ncbi:Hypothetical predicted protein [Xyrichtys novacula]|uniref:Uncharacterized protein n=1 Tax=Xyrichtys novacula TaxID=13765 RepID=A0AAV1FVD7_XYRNO|nr:Hypothetical predicted protein [Xyrichtys novacula]
MIKQLIFVVGLSEKNHRGGQERSREEPRGAEFTDYTTPCVPGSEILRQQTGISVSERFSVAAGEAVSVFSEGSDSEITLRALWLPACTAASIIYGVAMETGLGRAGV